MLGLSDLNQESPKPSQTLKNSSTYSQLSPYGHPAIRDARYCGQNPAKAIEV